MLVRAQALTHPEAALITLETLVMAMVALSAVPAQNVLSSLRPLVLYVSVSHEVAETLASDGVPSTATGQTWVALREDVHDAAYRASLFDTGAAALDAVMLEVHILPAGWEQLVRRRLLFPAPKAGSWRFYGVLPAVMKDDQDQMLMHCNFWECTETIG